LIAGASEAAAYDSLAASAPKFAGRAYLSTNAFVVGKFAASVD
jgi:hypothetical protein